MQKLDALTSELVRLLHSNKQTIVFAESCTAGLISASMGRIPGVSSVLAGSAVVYQLPTKTAWLNVDEELLEDAGPVSQQVSEQMAMGVLKITSHARMSASITGHLGPDAPAGLDGIAWSTIAVRQEDSVVCQSHRLVLETPSGGDSTGIRRHRQVNAAEQVLFHCVNYLNGIHYHG